jgi:hypothetical protein
MGGIELATRLAVPFINGTVERPENPVPVLRYMHGRHSALIPGTHYLIFPKELYKPDTDDSR